MKGRAGSATWFQLILSSLLFSFLLLLPLQAGLEPDIGLAKQAVEKQQKKEKRKKQRSEVKEVTIVEFRKNDELIDKVKQLETQRIQRKLVLPISTDPIVERRRTQKSDLKGFVGSLFDCEFAASFI